MASIFNPKNQENAIVLCYIIKCLYSKLLMLQLASSQAEGAQEEYKTLFLHFTCIFYF